MIYTDIIEKSQQKKLIGILIDPDEYDPVSLGIISRDIEQSGIDYILVGGSLVSTSVDESVKTMKEYTKCPVLLFPGNVLQISGNADGILLLCLISGRNPEYLIGNHVTAAPLLRKSGLEVIPTGYILIENGRTTSVEYITNTKPIPAGKTDLVTATAMAGEMLGHKLIYLEAGSGAENYVKTHLIREVRKSISIPLIVGGGIRSRAAIEAVLEAGADMVVIGNAIQEDPSFISSLSAINKGG